MQRLNAIDAITPAFGRVHELLFRPFRLGHSWKLAAASYLGVLGSVFLPLPLLLLVMPQIPGVDIKAFHVLILGIAALAAVLILIFFYLGARMYMVNLQILITRQTRIGPIWQRYAYRVWPWIGLKAAIGTLITGMAAPWAMRFIAGFITLMATMPRVTPGQPQDPVALQHFFAQMLQLYAGIFLYFFVVKYVSTILDDFALPFFLLEDISLGAALRRGADVILADPLQSILYLVLKPILAFIGFVMYYVLFLLALIVVVLVILLVAAVGGGLLYLLMHFGGTGLKTIGGLLLIAGGVVLYAAYAIAIFWYQFGSMGYLMMLLDAYALFFLGGRYPLLGNMLEAGERGPFTPPPVFPSPDEEENDDGGPPMPMNPAVA